MVTPRSTSTLSVELERSSKTEPLGLKFALLSDYYDGVIVTEASAKALAAGIRVGDCVNLVGSRRVTTVEDCEASLKCIAGEVELQLTRSKKLPTGWSAVEDNGRMVLKVRTFQPTEAPTSRPVHQLSVDAVPGSKGLELTTNSKGFVVVHSVKKDSMFSKHVRPGDKLTKVNDQDFACNAIGASRALTGTSGPLRIVGTFLPPSEKCAATGCQCCAHLAPKVNVSAPTALKKTGSVTLGADGKFHAENTPDGMAAELVRVEMARMQEAPKPEPAVAVEADDVTIETAAADADDVVVETAAADAPEDEPREMPAAASTASAEEDLDEMGV